MVTEILDLEAFKMYIKANKNSCQAKFDKAISYDVLEMMCARSPMAYTSFSFLVLFSMKHTHNVTQKLSAITCRSSFTASRLQIVYI